MITIMPEIGKLYYNCEMCFLICPSPAQAFTSLAALPTLGVAAYHARLMGEQVSYCEKNTPLLIVDKDPMFHGTFKVLVQDKLGWVKVPNWLQLKECNSG